MRLPWFRALTGCLQMLVRREDDIDIAKGLVEFGELRPSAFAELFRCLPTTQQLSLSLLTIADVAVWPQLEPSVASAIDSSLDGHSSQLNIGPQLAEDQSAVGAIAAATVAAQARILSARLQSGTTLHQADSDAIRRAVHSIARLSNDPNEYWEYWLRRVVPQSINRTPQDALRLARAALGCSLPVCSRWSFGATTYTHRDGSIISVDDLRAPSQFTRDIAHFSPYAVHASRLEASMVPMLDLDDYRMGYLFQTLFVEGALDDVEQGNYTVAVCRNAKTGSEWTFPAL